MPADPFEGLTHAASPVRPNPQFAIALRQRLLEELDMTTTDKVLDDRGASAGVPPRLAMVHLRVGDSARAVAFFGALFGWEAETWADGEHHAAYVNNTDI